MQGHFYIAKSIFIVTLHHEDLNLTAVRLNCRSSKAFHLHWILHVSFQKNHARNPSMHQVPCSVDILSWLCLVVHLWTDEENDPVHNSLVALFKKFAYLMVLSENVRSRHIAHLWSMQCNKNCSHSSNDCIVAPAFCSGMAIDSENCRLDMECLHCITCPHRPRGTCSVHLIFPLKHKHMCLLHLQSRVCSGRCLAKLADVSITCLPSFTTHTLKSNF